MEAPTLTSRNLILKPWKNTPEDLALYLKTFEDDQVQKFLLGGNRVDRQWAEDRFQRMFDLIPGSLYHWSVWREGRLAGRVELGTNNHQFDGDFEIRGCTLPRDRGNQTAPETARTVLKFAFEDLKLPRVRAMVSFENLNAAIVLHRIGFIPKIELIENQIVWVWTAYKDLTLYKKLHPAITN